MKVTCSLYPATWLGRLDETPELNQGNRRLPPLPLTLRSLCLRANRSNSQNLHALSIPSITRNRSAGTNLVPISLLR